MFIRRTIALAIFGLVLAGGAPALAHDATPMPAGEPDISVVLIEHADNVTTIDQGASGPSVGDVIVWGPDPLYDEANETDTGATTQGFCTAFTAVNDCVLVETIVFPDGSTLELQGVQPGQPVQSTRTIVAGSGDYLGASGTVTVSPSEDLSTWTKIFAIWIDD